MANITRPADKKPLEADGRFKLEWESLFTLLLAAVNAVSQGSLVATQVYTVATVPSAVDAGAGRVIYVSNGAAGLPVLAYSDGTIWRRSDTATVIV